MELFETTIAGIVPLTDGIAGKTQALLDNKTKPRRSLGRLEDLACRMAAITGFSEPPLPKKAVVVMAGDHGVAEEGVSAFPQEVTAQMVLNFASGGAAINVLARHAGAEVIVVDIGVKSPLPAHPAVRSLRVANGTRNFTKGPAMTREETVAALETGIRIADELVKRGIGLVGLGEMGIANTTSASALGSVFTGKSAAEMTGRGTGVDDEGLKRKIAVIEKAIAINRPDSSNGLETLQKLGGLEIAGLAGVALGAALRRVPVVIDGVISSAAALAAVRIAPNTRDYLIASHRSVEPAHRHILAALGLEPLFEMDMRLGEGTGAALAMTVMDAALKILHEMATFSSAGVSDSGQ